MSAKVVFIVAQRDFRDEELLQTREVLERFGVQTYVAADSQEPAHGKFGSLVLPSLTIQGVSARHFDGIIFVGGPGARGLFEKRTVLRRAQEFAQANKVVAAICSAPTILANAGLLMGKRATAFPTEETVLRDHGAEYTGLPVEADGNLITAKDSTYARDFAERIAWELGR
ncbi:MAG: protease I [Parcubacteria group bacterium Gr01-1014_31]|nr:MAG: protease I [Parcubacteria group bacterium Gr01-1014_31]